MTITINGTTGISGVDGTASTPAIQGNDTNTGMFFPAADTIAFAEGGAEVARFDSSGNLGIGTSSPNEALTVQRGSASPAAITIRGNGNSAASESYIGQGADNNFYLYNRANNAIVFGTNNTNQAVLTNTGLFQFNSGYGSVATAYGCRAWVNFNGTGTVAIRASGNVSSITDNGTGDYTVNFTTAMPDANYAAVVSTEEDSGGDGKFLAFLKFNGRATTSVGVEIGYVTGALRYDLPYVAVSVFR